MNRKTFPAFIWWMWLALPITAFHSTEVWDRMPLRMAPPAGASGSRFGRHEAAYRLSVS
jgi:hypothetical protein